MKITSFNELQNNQYFHKWIRFVLFSMRNLKMLDAGSTICKMIWTEQSFLLGLLGLLSSKQVHQVLSFVLSSSVGAQSLLGNLQGSLGILQGTSLEELDHSLFISSDTGNLVDDFSDEGGSLGDSSLLGGRLHRLRLDLSCLVTLVLSDGNCCCLVFSH